MSICGQTLTQTALKSMLHYDPGTGEFTWLVRPANSVRVGDIAGTIMPDGYRHIRLFRKCYGAHRLAHFYMTGSWPPHQVDHENHDRDDNRWSKIRLATHKENSKNRSLPSNNTTGICGVIWHKGDQRWQASITVDSNSIYLGNFKTILAAAYARHQAEMKHGFHPNHGAKP